MLSELERFKCDRAISAVIKAYLLKFLQTNWRSLWITLPQTKQAIVMATAVLSIVSESRPANLGIGMEIGVEVLDQPSECILGAVQSVWYAGDLTTITR